MIFEELAFQLHQHSNATVKLNAYRYTPIFTITSSCGGILSCQSKKLYSHTYGYA